MFHVVALVVAAILWIAYGTYRFRKPTFRYYLLKLASYLLGGAVLVWYEIHMFWYWLALGTLLIVPAMFDNKSSAGPISGVASDGPFHRRTD